MGDHVYLVGMPGAGKSSVGERLAERLGLPFVDLDAEIERSAGRTVAELFAVEGEAGFRAREGAALREAAAGPARVVACGGGVVGDPANRDLLRGTGTVVYLAAPLETLAARLRPYERHPLLSGDGDLAALMAEREAWYEATCHLRIDATGGAKAVAAEVAAALAEAARA